MERRARDSAPKTHRGGQLFAAMVALVIVGIVGYVLGTMPHWHLWDPDSPFAAGVKGLTAACVILVVVGAVGGFRCIASTTDPVRASLALVSFFLVLTIAVTIGFTGPTEDRLGWVGPIAAIVGVGLTVGVVGGLVDRHTTRHD